VKKKIVLVAVATFILAFGHRAERRAQNETFAPVPSFLQGHTSINTVSSGFLVA
jgi:hypothetical protein